MNKKIVVNKGVVGLVIFVLFLAGLVLATTLVQRRQTVSNRATAPSDVTLYTEPSRGCLNVNQTVDFIITANAGVNRVDSYSLQGDFNSTYMEVEAFTPLSSFTVIRSNLPGNGSFSVDAVDIISTRTGVVPLGKLTVRVLAAGSNVSGSINLSTSKIAGMKAGVPGFLSISLRDNPMVLYELKPAGVSCLAATVTLTPPPTGYPSCSTYGCSTLVGLTTTTSCPASYPYQTVICHGTFSGITQDWRCCNLAAPTPTPTHAPTCGGCSTLVDPTMACPVGYPKDDGVCYVLPPVNQNLRCCNLVPTATPTPGYCFNIAGLPDCIGGTNAVVVSSACEACQADRPVRCKTNTSSGYVVACSTRPTTTLTPTPTPGYCPRGAEGNLNCGGDGIINLYDLMLMINENVWRKVPVPPVPAYQHSPDISPAGGNGIVDVSDLSRLLNNWSR